MGFRALPTSPDSNSCSSHENLNFPKVRWARASDLGPSLVINGCPPKCPLLFELVQYSLLRDGAVFLCALSSRCCRRSSFLSAASLSGLQAGGLPLPPLCLKAWASKGTATQQASIKKQTKPTAASLRVWVNRFGLTLQG